MPGLLGSRLCFKNQDIGTCGVTANFSRRCLKTPLGLHLRNKTSWKHMGLKNIRALRSWAYGYTSFYFGQAPQNLVVVRTHGCNVRVSLTIQPDACMGLLVSLTKFFIIVSKLLSLSQNFLILISKFAISLQSASPLFLLLSPPPQHSFWLQLIIILIYSGVLNSQLWIMQILYRYLELCDTCCNKWYSLFLYNTSRPL